MGMPGWKLGAPKFESQPCVKLHSTPLKRWKGLLFAGPLFLLVREQERTGSRFNALQAARHLIGSRRGADEGAPDDRP